MDKLDAKLYMFLSEQDGSTPSRVLEEHLGLKGTEVRSMINSMRREGAPIGSDSRGYYICKDYDQFEQTINNLESRARAIQSAADGMRTSWNRFLDVGTI